MLRTYLIFTNRSISIFPLYNSWPCIRRFSQASQAQQDDPCPVERKGLILGVYSDAEGKEHKLTAASQKFNGKIGGQLEQLLRDGVHLNLTKGHAFQNLDPEYHTVAVVGLGKEDTGFNELENLDECKEAIRIAAATGVRKLRQHGCTMIHCEGMGHTESAGEGAGLATYRYQELKDKKKRKEVADLELYFDDDKDGWQRGILKAEAQNIARRLCDTPANLMTPALFAQAAVEVLCPCGVSVEVRDKDWMATKNMNAILAAARGSCEPPVFLELGYCGGTAEDKPILLVGKGVTFDSGGLCLKKCKGMMKYKGDMTGAATIVGVMRAAASLSLPLNIQAVIPLCENMPSGMAMKPGDVVQAMSGKSIVIDNPDSEGRLVLADALVYGAQVFKPKLIVDIASLTHGARNSLGSSATAVFCNNKKIWKQLEKAGAVSGDRVWRLPLWKYFTRKIKNTRRADTNNVGPGHGTPCKGAAFLREFVKCGDWVHMDTHGTGMVTNDKDFPYLSINRMSGRPTRTVIQFLYQLACPPK